MNVRPQQVSVIIPTYNRHDALLRALASVSSQTAPPGEVMVVDDGSSDGTGASVRAMYPGARLLTQVHAGVSAARNLGIGEARGEWIALLDSDDQWHPDKLERQCAILSARPEFRICHTEEIWIRRGRRVNPMAKHAKAGGWIFNRCLPRCVISPSSVMLHREVFERVGGFDEALPACEDYDLWLRVCCRFPVLFLAEPLITRYGGHADQLSRRHWGMDRFRIRALEKILGEGVLSGTDRLAALRTLVEKLAIVRNGALKRDNIELADEYGARLARYGQMHRW